MKEEGCRMPQLYSYCFNLIRFLQIVILIIVKKQKSRLKVVLFTTVIFQQWMVVKVNVNLGT